jgi:phage shock protein PspC (stress-responsive transcriptional regulator)
MTFAVFMPVSLGVIAMNNTMIRYLLIVLAVIGAITLAVLLGMWLMHETMMGREMMGIGTER